MVLLATFSLMIYSIVICAQNEEENIIELLISIRNLKLPRGLEVEIILVDDHSVDRTVELARSAKVKNLRITKSFGKGAAAARNKGIALSTGEVILFVDCDGTLDKNSLKWFQKVIPSKKNPDLVQGNIWAQYYSPKLNVYLSRWREIVFKDQITNADKTLCNFNSRCIAVRSSFLKKFSPTNKFFNDQIPNTGGEDFDCGRRVFKFGGKILLEERAIFYHKDPKNFISMIIKRYQNGFADARAGVGQVFFDLQNFNRTVTNPLKVGVPLWFSFSFLVILHDRLFERKTKFL